MAISVTPVLPVQPAQEVVAVTPELALQPGTTINATVLKVLSADLVRIAIASLSIDVKTE
ncbi:MAG: flagellar hook-length control protein FliK, partial [Bradyrhizobium icense]